MIQAGRYSRDQGRRRSREGGISWLEFSLSLALLAAFAALLLAALLDAQATAERAAVDATIMNLKSALRLQVADRLVHGREGELREFPGSNPVRWLDKPPAPYLGEEWGPPAQAEPGAWYFDRRSGELVYLPRAVERFRREDGKGPEIRWRVRGLEGNRGATAGKAGASAAVPEGITIDITTPYAVP